MASDTPDTKSTTRANLPQDDNGNAVQALALGDCEVLDVASIADTSAAIGVNGVFVTLDQPAHVFIGPAASAPATTSNHYLPKDQVFFFKCEPTDVVSVIKKTGASDGKAYVSGAKT